MYLYYIIVCIQCILSYIHYTVLVLSRLLHVHVHNCCVTRAASRCVSVKPRCSEIGRVAVTIVTYGLLRHAGSKLLQEALYSQNFKVVIVDESHYIKNRKAATTKYLLPLLRRAPHKVLLTGTPALARPEEVRFSFVPEQTFFSDSNIFLIRSTLVFPMENIFLILRLS